MGRHPSSRSAFPESGGDGKEWSMPFDGKPLDGPPSERSWFDEGCESPGSVLTVTAAAVIALIGWLLRPRSAFFWEPLVRGCRSDMSLVMHSGLVKPVRDFAWHASEPYLRLKYESAWEPLGGGPGVLGGEEGAPHASVGQRHRQCPCATC